MLMIENIPVELHNLKQWVCWKKALNDKGKVTKIPINPFTGKNAMSNNPDTWSDMMGATIGMSMFGLDGIGFMLENGYFGIDLDDCSEELKQEFINTIGSYTEISQSGKGIHIICKGELPKGARRTKGIEMYDSQRFFVMTGNVIGNYNIIDATEKVKPLYNKYLVKEKEQPIPAQTVQPEVINISDSEVLKKAQNSKNGTQFKLLFDGDWEALNYPSQSEADLAMCNILAFWTGKNKEQMDRIFRMSGLYREKWDRRQGGTTYGNATLQTAVNNCQTVYSSASPVESSIKVDATTGAITYVRDTKKSQNFLLNDTGNAQRFVDRYGGMVKFNFENKQWRIYNGKYWQGDLTNQIKQYAEVVINEMRLEAFRVEDEKERNEKLKNAERAFSSKGKENLLKEAMHVQGIPCVNADFDKDQFLINTESGVVDLRTGKLLQHDKDLMISKIVPHKVDLKNPPVRWLKFLQEIFMGDKELIEYIQRAIGYTLTGSIEEQCLFMCYGDGDNGKSVFLDLLSAMLGDYSATASVNTILERKADGSATSDLARLKGARFVTTGENNEGSRINEGLIKQLTGGEKITARFLYGIEFEYTPEFKLWIGTNHKFIIRGTDKGIWRRIHPVPFRLKMTEEQKDKRLIFKLIEEIPQILGWAIEGAIKWRKEGFVIPRVVKEAHDTYKNQMDVVSMFLDENCSESADWRTSSQELYKEYEKWAKNSNEFVMSSTKFGIEMSKRYQKERTTYGMVYIGIQLNKDKQAYTYQKYNV